MRRTQIPVSLWIVLVAIALYAGVSAWTSIQRLVGLYIVGWDITNVTQAIWNTAHGAPFAMTNQYPLTNRLGGHVEPVILLLAPLAWIAGNAPNLSISLLILQAVVVACGALPVYLLAKDELKSSYGAVTFSILYLLYPAVGAILSFEFHTVTLAAGLWLWAIYCVHRQKWAGVAVFSLLALSCKENMSLLLLLFGIYLALSKQGHRVLGMSLALTGGIWFAASVFWIQPLFSPTGASVQMENYGWMGSSMVDKATLFFRDPQKIWLHVDSRVQPYARQLLAPWGFISILSPLRLALILPELAINLLSAKAQQVKVESGHYASALIPFVVWSAVSGAAWLQKKIGLGLEKINRRSWERYVVSLLFTALLGWGLVYHYYRGYSPLSQNYSTPTITAHALRIHEFAAVVPDSASILTQPSLGPFFSQRPEVYSDVRALSKADFLLVDAKTLVEGYDSEVLALIKSNKDFGLIKAADGYALFQRGVSSGQLPDDFFSFARASEADIQYPTQARFGDALEFLGYNLGVYRSDDPKYCLYVRPLKALGSRYSIALYLLDGEDNLVAGSVDQPSVMVWYPMSRWQVGETVELCYDQLPGNIGPMQQFGYALGVLSASDPWNVAARLRPTIVESDWQGWLPADGTLLGFVRLHKTWSMIKGGPPLKLAALPWGVAERHVALAEGVSLAGVNLPAGVKAGETLPITLYWQADGPTSTSYTTFVHLVDEQGALVAQSDSIPGKGTLPSTAWAPGEVIPDPRLISLPADMPQGIYTLLVGLYDATNGRRLSVTDGKADAKDNAIVIERIQISR
jgi:uncharacterized membrane protein